jgi:DNA polymerase I-like protein with 3'-5' exonuclease and polymerase domains
MGSGTFSEKHGIPAKEAKRLIQAHDARWPALVRYRQRVAWLAHSQRYLDTPFDWRRYFWTPFRGSETSIERWGDAREAVSHLPQSTAASIFKRALARLPPEAVWAARHDEIVLHVPEDEAAAWGVRLKQIMEQPWPQLRGSDLYPDGLTISAEIGIGRRWGVSEVT